MPSRPHWDPDNALHQASCQRAARKEAWNIVEGASGNGRLTSSEQRRLNKMINSGSLSQRTVKNLKEKYDVD